MSITINGATNTLTAASGLTIAGNTAVTGTLSSTGILNVGTNKCRVFPTGAAIQGILAGVQIDSYDDNLSLFASPAAPGTNTFQICGYTPDSGGWLSMLETSHVASGYPTVKIGQGASGFVGTFSSTGLAVTGTIVAIGASNTDGQINIYNTTTRATNNAYGIRFADSSFETNASIRVVQNGAGNNAASLKIGVNSGAGGAVITSVTDVLSIEPTGLAVTGGVTASSTNGIFTATGTTGWSGLSVTKTGGNLTVGIDDGVTFGYTDGDGVIRYTNGKSLNILETSGATTASFSASAITANQNIVMASGKGIDFSATSNGSGTTTSEVLSDYEEGTWTPAISYTTPGTLSVTYSTQQGKYTKIGRQVTVSAWLVLTAFTKGTASGSLIISGLPFTQGGTVPDVGNILLNGAPFSGRPGCYAYTGTDIFLYSQSTNAALVALDDPDANSQYFVTLTYFV